MLSASRSSARENIPPRLRSIGHAYVRRILYFLQYLKNCWYRYIFPTELVDPVGWGIEAVQKRSTATGYIYRGIPAPRVRVHILHTFHGNSVNRYGRLTELIELSGTGKTRVNTPGIQRLLPYRTQPWIPQYE